MDNKKGWLRKKGEEGKIEGGKREGIEERAREKEGSEDGREERPERGKEGRGDISILKNQPNQLVMLFDLPPTAP